MPKQEIKKIRVKDLHLWTENPRDHVNTNDSDLNVMKRAVEDSNSKWNLKKLLEEMGPHYDFSELPTVVKVDGKYIVYDGNRRIAVLKYLQNQQLYSSLNGGLLFNQEPKELRDLKEIPCNVCDKETALTNVERKHVNSGTWDALERDYFRNIHRGQSKSPFLIFEEQTGLISTNPKLNKRFVKEEVLNEQNLEDVGIHFDKIKGFISNYTEKENKEIIEKIASLVEKGVISTRENRKKLKKSLLETYPILKNKIKLFDENKEINTLELNTNKNNETTGNKKTPRTKNHDLIFGKKLSLKPGDTNDLYRDIIDLFDFYQENKGRLSENFCSLIRMSLRLIVESATNKKIDLYIKDNFEKARISLSDDERTTLSSHSITEKKLIELLHVGAHKYSVSKNIEQTVAISVIVGAMLQITHSKK